MKTVREVLYTVFSVVSVFSMLSGCGSGSMSGQPAPSAAQPAGNPAAPPAEESGESAGPVREEDDRKTDAENVPAKMSLAKRMCGKYSWEGEDGTVYTMHVTTFGNNLYALCGEAIEEEKELSLYSFWAAEFLPYDKAEAESTEGTRIKVRELRFSVMSNFSRYWDGGKSGTITLTDEGLECQGFEDEGFLCPPGSSRVFSRDERVEEIFPYLNAAEADAPAALSGLWTLSGGAQRIYLEFAGGNLTIYKKAPELEVFYARGGCSFTQDGFTCRLNSLENGGMPWEIEGSYQLAEEKLMLTLSGEGLPEELNGRKEFVKAQEKDIPLVSADEANPDASVFVSDGDTEEQTASAADPTVLKEQDFYGVFISASTTSEELSPVLEQLEEKGFTQCTVVYTPDFSNLNPKPWYTAAAGLFRSEKDAEAMLSDLQKAGFPDAYIKYTGRYIGDHCLYTSYSGDNIEILEDRIILHAVQVALPYPTDGEMPVMDLIVDRETVFDPSAELDFFGNYRKGDSPYTWIEHNCRLLNEDTDAYLADGPALSGVFEVALEGSRIKTYYGSYWWD